MKSIIWTLAVLTATPRQPTPVAFLVADNATHVKVDGGAAPVALGVDPHGGMAGVTAAPSTDSGSGPQPRRQPAAYRRRQRPQRHPQRRPDRAEQLAGRRPTSSPWAIRSRSTPRGSPYSSPNEHDRHARRYGEEARHTVGHSAPRFPSTNERDQMTACANNVFIPVAVPPTLVNTPPPLRDYQEEAVRQGIRSRDDVSRLHVVDLPTASGKTRVGIALADDLVRHGYGILWVGKSWRHLEQAAEQMATVCPWLKPRLRRVGGADSCLGDLPEGDDGLIYFTTVQTHHKRRGSLPARVRPPARLAVIWDECHWAVNSPLGRGFLNFHLNRAVCYGLTATPVEGDNAHVIHRTAPDQLWGTVLAQPRHHEVPTDVTWNPDVSGDDFTPSSLRELGGNPRRNRQIVAEFLDGRGAGRYRRTLMFACDIAHAESLTKLLSEHGVPAAYVHSRMRRPEQDRAIERFRQGQVAVLVNVAMLTEGVDIPEIDSLFLCRPTRSLTLLKQMIGRGARKAPGKVSFWVVDFLDNLAGRAADVLSVAAVLTQPNGWRPSRRRSGGRAPAHREPLDLPHFEDVSFPGVGVLPVALGQTFGVEMELTGPHGVPRRDHAWTRLAHVLIGRLRGTAIIPVHPDPLNYHQASDPTTWRVMHDGSAGWEVVSPILVDAQGFEELRRVCDGLTALVAQRPRDFHLNHRTGMHITLGTRLNTDERLRGFIKRVQRLEPGLFTLTSPSRLFPFDAASKRYSPSEGNNYCYPLRMVGNVDGLRLGEFLNRHAARYHTVNLTRSFSDIQTLEVRMHGGTTEFRKIGLWLSLWMQLFNRSRYAWAGDGVTGPVFPGGNELVSGSEAEREDVIRLLAEEGIALTPGFAKLLRRRRRELCPSWRKVLRRRVLAWNVAELEGLVRLVGRSQTERPCARAAAG
jgi:superfamily II DNA or RNA helicase